jgi:hypothetical protein
MKLCLEQAGLFRNFFQPNKFLLPHRAPIGIFPTGLISRFTRIDFGLARRFRQSDRPPDTTASYTPALGPLSKPMMREFDVQTTLTPALA